MDSWSWEERPRKSRWGNCGCGCIGWRGGDGNGNADDGEASKTLLGVDTLGSETAWSHSKAPLRRAVLLMEKPRLVSVPEKNFSENIKSKKLAIFIRMSSFIKI